MTTHNITATITCTDCKRTWPATIDIIETRTNDQLGLRLHAIESNLLSLQGCRLCAIDAIYYELEHDRTEVAAYYADTQTP